MFTPLWMSQQRQMFTLCGDKFMKNTLFFEQRRSNVHPFYEEYTLL